MRSVEYLQKLNKSPELRNLEWAKCHDDPYYWLTNWAYTLDVHDQSNPQKPFPEKDYIKLIVDLWLKNKILLFPKSRQMMLSWLFTALYLWDTQFHFGRLTFFQSKKADDANDLVKRAKLIWDNEPKFLKRYYENGEFKELKCNPQNQGQHVYSLLTFPDIKSEIRGIPEGGDVVRMHTLSGILCLGPDTKVLKGDLTWDKISNIKVGDELIGFDENIGDSGHGKNGVSNSRRWRKTVVQKIHKLIQPSYKLTFSDGTEVISSENHRWLAGYGQKSKWIKTKNLRVQSGGRAGSRIFKILDTWETKNDYNSGYLSAALDGEGSFDQFIDINEGSIKTSRIRITFSQNNNAMLKRVRDIYKEFGYDYTESILKGKTGKRYSKPHHVIRVGIKSEILRILGEVRPQRLLEKLDIDKFGQVVAKEGVTLIKKELIKEAEVIGLTTSTKTFIAEGLASHNSDESAFQPEMASAFTALKPTLSSGGRLTCVSTAEDSTWFEDACFDRLEM